MGIEKLSGPAAGKRSIEWDRARVLAGRYVVAERWQWLGVLARLIRAEILRFDRAAAAAAAASGSAAGGVARPRFIVYAPDAE